MIDLEKLIWKAKPVVPDLPEEFASTVMEKIAQLDTSTGVIAKRTPSARIQFGFGILGLIIATLLFNYNTYEIRMNGSLELLYFGRQYLFDFLGYLPFDLLVPSLLITLVSVWMFRKSGIIKRGIASLVIISYLITSVGGSALAAIGFNDQVEATISENEGSWTWLKIFQHSRARQFIQHPHMKLGKVEKIVNGKAEVLTPNGETLHVQLPPQTDVQVGQYIRTSGMVNQSIFSARKVHVCNPIRVNRYFGHMKHHNMMNHRGMMKSCCSKNQ
jgi:hypothetical protein